MKVEFRTNKLKRQCEDPSLAQKEFGANIGNRLTQRIGELLAASSLKDIMAIPSARLHKLEGSREDLYAVDLVHPHRLVFRPILENGNDIRKLERITVIRIE
jgi:proteic killer suppression protein